MVLLIGRSMRITIWRFYIADGPIKLDAFADGISNAGKES